MKLGLECLGLKKKVRRWWWMGVLCDGGVPKKNKFISYLIFFKNILLWNPCQNKKNI